MVRVRDKRFVIGDVTKRSVVIIHADNASIIYCIPDLIARRPMEAFWMSFEVLLDELLLSRLSMLLFNVCRAARSNATLRLFEMPSPRPEFMGESGEDNMKLPLISDRWSNEGRREGRSGV